MTQIAAALFAWDALESLIDTALRIESSESHHRNIFKSLFTGLFGHIEFWR